MSCLELDGQILRKMIISGAEELDLNRDFVNSLNVFPVPDGDTGTNMSLTVLSAAQEIDNLKSNDVSAISKAAAMGALKGARGNSGVILSQLFRGFAKELENISVATLDDLARAFMRASKLAYKSVMKPKEGTILTMAREVANKICEEVSSKKNKNKKDLEEIFYDAIVYGEKILKKTPEMLPQLKQAGVVDSGACGLLLVLAGAIKVLNNKRVFNFCQDKKNNVPAQSFLNKGGTEFSHEILLDIKDCDENKLNIYKRFLVETGDSLVISDAGEFTRIHVHTNKVGESIEKALEFWSLLNIRIENLKNQSQDFLEKHDEDKSDNNQKNVIDFNQEKSVKKKFGFVAVSTGKGFDDLFKNLGVDEIVNGGQSMNPSTKDILDAIKDINAESIVVLPNNKNIILTAQQAAELDSQHKIIVLPTRSMPEGLSVMLSYLPDEENIDKNISQMRDAIKSVKTGQVTYAVRDTKLDNKNITKDDILCMTDDKIVSVEKNLETAVKNLIDKMLEHGGDVLTIYFGCDVKKADAEKIFDYAREKYADTEVEIHSGGQPIYYYIISVE